MSKQFGDMPQEDDRNRTQGKRGKRHGKFDVWIRRQGTPIFKGDGEWFRWRKYATREVADEALKRMRPKWRGWQFEVREV